MSEPVVPAVSLARRNLIRGGALAVGAAGAAVAIDALNATTAHAANGDAILAGQANSATASTSLTANGASQPVLKLSNSSGPALHLAPVTGSVGNTAAGDIVSRANGPEVTVDYGQGLETTYLATGFDLPPSTFAFSPVRVMDTRQSAMRDQVYDASSSAWYDSSKRVKAGAWIDVPLDIAADGLDYFGVYLNVTAIGAPSKGNLSVYPAGEDAPSASNLNYPATTSIANLCFVAPTLLNDEVWCVRVKVNVAAVHVILDFSGAVGFFPPAPELVQRGRAAAGRRNVYGPRQANAVRAKIVKGLGLKD